jgi:predicted class III extradiol MEMO1 family dioxygenase
LIPPHISPNWTDNEPSLHIRPPAVAGMFYPADADELAAGGPRPTWRPSRPAGIRPKVLIVPHAGYVYSGAVAARAYALLAPARQRIRRVVLLGPAHRVPIRGLALPVAEAFATPLGGVRIDAEGRRRRDQAAAGHASDVAHNLEHSLEVQLPFLQTRARRLHPAALRRRRSHAGPGGRGARSPLGRAGNAHPHQLRPLAFPCLRHGAGHRPGTVGAILAFEPTIEHEQACGATPINGLLLCARRRGLAIEQLDLRNSGDTAGDRSPRRRLCRLRPARREPHAEH